MAAYDLVEVDELLSKHSVLTFRFLAQEAEMPVSDAKAALEAYAKENEGKCHVVYLLGGLLDGGLKYKLVPEDSLEAGKEQFAELTACHPYSIHAKPATSGEPLFLLNHYEAIFKTQVR